MQKISMKKAIEVLVSILGPAIDLSDQADFLRQVMTTPLLHEMKTWLGESGIHKINVFMVKQTFGFGPDRFFYFIAEVGPTMHHWYINQKDTIAVKHAIAALDKLRWLPGRITSPYFEARMPSTKLIPTDAICLPTKSWLIVEATPGSGLSRIKAFLSQFFPEVVFVSSIHKMTVQMVTGTIHSLAAKGKKPVFDITCTKSANDDAHLIHIIDGLAKQNEFAIFYAEDPSALSRSVTARLTHLQVV